MIMWFCVAIKKIWNKNDCQHSKTGSKTHERFKRTLFIRTKHNMLCRNLVCVWILRPLMGDLAADRPAWWRWAYLGLWQSSSQLQMISPTLAWWRWACLGSAVLKAAKWLIMSRRHRHMHAYCRVSFSLPWLFPGRNVVIVCCCCCVFFIISVTMLLLYFMMLMYYWLSSLCSTRS